MLTVRAALGANFGAPDCPQLGAFGQRAAAIFFTTSTFTAFPNALNARVSVAGKYFSDAKH
jgi:hypothetical protein